MFNWRGRRGGDIHECGNSIEPERGDLGMRSSVLFLLVRKQECEECGDEFVSLLEDIWSAQVVGVHGFAYEVKGFDDHHLNKQQPSHNFVFFCKTTRVPFFPPSLRRSCGVSCC